MADKTTFEKLVETGLFQQTPGTRTLYTDRSDLQIFDMKRETPCGLRAELNFDQWGDFVNIVIRPTMPWEKHG